MKNINIVSLCLILVFMSSFLSTTFAEKASAKKVTLSKKLPYKQKFPTSTKLSVYFSKAQIEQPTVIDGSGFWTLLFEPTDKPNIASVRLIDIGVKFSPFSANFDINHDGKPETFDVKGIELGSGDFDLEISKGTVNLNTGEFSITIGHILTPKSIPLLKEVGADMLQFSFTEKGIMDLETNKFKTYTGTFLLPKPFERIILSGNEGPPCCPVILHFWSDPTSVPTAGGQVTVSYLASFHEGGKPGGPICNAKAGANRTGAGSSQLRFKNGTPIISSHHAQWLIPRHYRFGFASNVNVSSNRNELVLIISAGDEEIDGKSCTVSDSLVIPVGTIDDIVVDGTGHVTGPLPVHTFALTNPAGTDIYPLSPEPGAYALFSLYDSGSTKVRINNILPKRIGGNAPESDADLLNLTTLATTNVRLNGLNRQNAANCSVPIGALGSGFPAQVQVTGIATKPYNKDATLIGSAVINQVIAHINYQQIINIPACAGLPTPASGPYMDFFLPDDTEIPTPDLVLTLERFGNTTSTDGSTAGQSYWLRNVIFQQGTNVVADDKNASNPIDFRFDTGTTLSIINDRMAGLLGLMVGPGSFNCFGGTNNGYVIDSVTTIGTGGNYRIENANICWQESAIVGANNVDAVIGSNFFDQVQIVFDGVNNTLGIIE